MILPLPYGVEGGAARPPRTVIALIAACAIAFALSNRSDTGAIAKEEASLERLAAWELEQLAASDRVLAGERERFPSTLAYLAAGAGWRERIAEAATRERLEGYLSDYQALTVRHPFYRYGLVPARLSLTGLVGHLFLHGDLLHLFFNMLFLWAVGAVLESDWGAGLFLAFYAACGFAAALTHAASMPASLEPAIGASGAIAGLMGAFAMQRARSRVRVILYYGPVRDLLVPAWVFLGAWFLEQVFFLAMTSRIQIGVAFGAHVGGFVFGAAASFLPRAWVERSAGGGAG